MIILINELFIITHCQPTHRPQTRSPSIRTSTLLVTTTARPSQRGSPDTEGAVDDRPFRIVGSIIEIEG